MIFKKNELLRKWVFKNCFLMKFLDDSAWLCMEKLKNAALNPIQLRFIKKIHQKITKIQKKNSFTRAL